MNTDQFLNEYGDPPFLLQNLTSLKVNKQLAKFSWKSMSSTISRELPYLDIR